MKNFGAKFLSVFDGSRAKTIEQPFGYKKPPKINLQAFYEYSNSKLDFIIIILM